MTSERPPTGLTRRRLLGASGAAAVAALAGCSTALDGESSSGTPSPTDGAADAPAGSALRVAPDEMAAPVESVASAQPLTDRPYPAMGDTDAGTTATVYGSWKCTHTATFAGDQLPRLVEEYVAPGSLALEFRDLAYWEGSGYLGPDAPAAGRAGLTVWDESPDAFWRYFGTVVANQPSEDVEWATPAQLAAFAEHAGVEPVEPVRTAAESDTGGLEQRLRETTSRVEALALDGVPRLVVDGTVTAPTIDPEATFAAVDEAVGE